MPSPSLTPEPEPVNDKEPVKSGHRACAPNLGVAMPELPPGAKDPDNPLSKIKPRGTSCMPTYLREGIDMLTISWFLSDVDKGVVPRSEAEKYELGGYEPKVILDCLKQYTSKELYEEIMNKIPLASLH